jgi:adenylate kinase family enzyme
MAQVNFMRVVVVGTSGSGKTTFARRLAGKLGTRCIELDALYWGSGWTPRSDFEQQVLLILQQPGWVIDGNYSLVRDAIWRRSTAIVWLDYSFPRTFLQAVRRTVHRVASGELLYSGNRESLRAALFDMEAPLWLVMRTYRRRRREYPLLFTRAVYRHATVIRLRAPAAADRLIAEVSTQGEGAFVLRAARDDGV